MRPIFVMIHSPLVGPATWEPVRVELRRRGVQAAVPALRDESESDLPYWRQQVESVVTTLRGAPAGQPLVLVGHSGAGALLPALGWAVDATTVGGTGAVGAIPGAPPQAASTSAN
ncbi:MAG TPA: hypothetical protein VEX37_02735, partial [Thermomicrobiales bacterium]|nr:hypothetical protein [Thermomicrobiales bacterium]